MSRLRKVALVGIVVAALLVGAILWALPEILRRAAVERIAKQTGRAAVIEDVDLNLFTGRLAVKGFRLADREGPEPFVEVERFDLRLGLSDLLRRHVRVREIALVGPSVRIVRLEPDRFNFSDLLAAPAAPSSTPSRWTVSVERARILRGRVRVDDRAVSPPAEWVVQDLEFDAGDVSTRVGAPPGRLSLGAQINEARLVAKVEPLGLDPLRFAGQLSLDGFETRRLEPYVYVPLGTPYRPKGGRFSAALTFDAERDGEEVRKGSVSGTLTLEGESLVRIGQTDPFVSGSRLGVAIKEADTVARTLTVESATIEGLDLKARRDARGVIDLIELFTPRASTPASAAGPRRAAAPTPAVPAPAPAAAPPRTPFPIIQGLARGFQEIRIERITLTPSVATFVDESVSPPARLRLTKLQARIDDFTWPATRPATVTLSTALPGGGTLDVKGPMTAYPFDAELAISIRDAPVEPYQAYIPIPARLSGRYHGDSRNRIAFHDGRLVAKSKGNSWAQNVEIREPGAAQPAIRVERMDLVGIDFDWPRRAAATRASFRRFRMDVERAADGSINLRRLFTPPAASPAAPASKPRAAPSAAQPPSKGILETMRLEFGEVRIDDGFVRFLDRTTKPAFSQDLSRLAVAVTDFGNRPGRRAKLTLQSIVGGDAGLDIRGEIGPLGAPASIDVVGELRSFKLPSVDPYASAAIGWVIKRGDLQYKVRFKLDDKQLSADNDLVIGHLQVAPASGADEVKRRIGMPLGLIVALIKDQQGDIRANVPVAGTLNDPKFSLGDAIWTAVKNVLVNIVTAPFKAIGRLFSGGSKGETVEEPRLDPVTFAAGSSVLSPAMEEHLLRVADFLRASPFVNLALASVPTAADVDALKSDAVAARLQAFQKEAGVSDPAAALLGYYKTRLPEVPLPATVEAQMALLRDREPAPEASIADLGRQRVAATRERLITAEGIPAARVSVEAVAGEASRGPAPAATGEGRIEFAIVAGE